IMNCIEFAIVPGNAPTVSNSDETHTCLLRGVAIRELIPDEEDIVGCDAKLLNSGGESVGFSPGRRVVVRVDQPSIEQIPEAAQCGLDVHPYVCGDDAQPATRIVEGH